jgi:hypothetical protein
MAEDMYRQPDKYVRDLRDFTPAPVAIRLENPPGYGYSQCVRVISSRLRCVESDQDTFRSDRAMRPRPPNSSTSITMVLNSVVCRK